VSRSEQNRRAHLKRKERQATGFTDVPTIPADLADDAKYNHLSDEEEARMSAAIEAATWAIHKRRQMKEDRKQPYTPREFATVRGRAGLSGIRAVG